MDNNTFTMTDVQAERFWSKVMIGDKDACWAYLGDTIDKNSRPRFAVGKRTIMAHRISFFLEYGDMPDKGIERTCKNSLCMNPRHMQLVE